MNINEEREGTLGLPPPVCPVNCVKEAAASINHSFIQQINRFASLQSPFQAAAAGRINSPLSPGLSGCCCNPFPFLLLPSFLVPTRTSRTACADCPLPLLLLLLGQPPKGKSRVTMAAAMMTALFALALASSAAGLVASAFDVLTTVAFDEGFRPLFGEANLERRSGDDAVLLTLNRYSGSGFVSKNYYHHGFFSANIKLPKDHTAGVVVAFYLSNGDVFEKDHDELDFEFLGNRRRHEWRLQTNVYGNGSTDRGREERYLMPFDPTAAAHRFSILWSSRVVIFYVDGVAVREVPRAPGMEGDYPSKPMAVYATIWDGSTWATDNGRYKVNYRRGPFTAEFSDLVLRGCPAAAAAVDGIIGNNNLLLELMRSPSSSSERCAGTEFELMTAEYAIMTPRKRTDMRRWRQRQMLYTVCYDTNRYPQPFPECDVNVAERQKFWEWGESKVVRPRVRSSRSSRRRTPPPALVSLQQADY